jgi:hypothetical protein
VNRKTLLISLLISLAVWATFSWPLPCHLFSGIPFSSLHRPAARTDVSTPVDQLPGMDTLNKSLRRTEILIPGDHLQLLYHFWLVADMIKGKTPLFTNVYEFNTGNDEERYRPDTCFFPFSLIYALGALIGGCAFGYNLTGFIALWLGFYFTWLLTNRYCPNRALAAVAALVSVFIPYRWHSLLCGSPSGLAMMWIPAILLGVDIAVRDTRIRGGVIAGIALLLASMSDQHTFFFGTVMVPGWCIFALLARQDFEWKSRCAYGRIATALSPVILLFGAAYWLTHQVVHRVADSTSAGGRDIAQVTIFTPRWETLVSTSSHFGNQVFLGYCLPALLLAGFAAAIIHALRNPRMNWRSALLILLLIIAIAKIVFLMLGPLGPFDGFLFRAARKLIPPYRMIRQTAKVFCLLPTFLAVASAFALWAISTLSERRWWKIAVPILFAAIVFVDYRQHVMAGVCLLQPEQGAYRRIEEDAVSRGVAPRAVVLPLWSGDYAESSLYLYYASLYRIRMLNGYSPIVGQDYMDDVYLRFERLNDGSLSDDELAVLRRMKIDYILLHEDIFPENISPFPVTFTLKNLLSNPQLQLLGRYDQTWAFRIPAEAGDEEPAGLGAGWTTYPAGRRWDAEACLTTNVAIMADRAVGGGTCISMNNADSAIETHVDGMSYAPGLRYMVRVRGSGTLVGEVSFSPDEGKAKAHTISVKSRDWTWIFIPVQPFDGNRGVNLRIAQPNGLLDVDYILLTAGDWEWNPPLGMVVSLPAPVLFHAGHIDVVKDSVFFKAGRRNGTMLYGPKLPLACGRYRIELLYSTTAPRNTRLGQMIIELCEDRRIGKIPVIAGQPAVFDLKMKLNMPLNVIFSYSGLADMDITKLQITRIE